MYEIALSLSIISSVLFIIYLAGLIFGKRQSEQNQTITITGRIVTTTVTTSVRMDESGQDWSGRETKGGRVVEGQVVDAKVLQSQIEKILKNVR